MLVYPTLQVNLSALSTDGVSSWVIDLVVGSLGHTYNKYLGVPLQPSTYIYIYDKANTGLMRSIRRGYFDRKRSRPDNRLCALLGRVPDLQISIDELSDLESRFIWALARLRRSLSNYKVSLGLVTIFREREPYFGPATLNFMPLPTLQRICFQKCKLTIF